MVIEEIEDKLVATLRELPEDKQRQILDFALSLGSVDSEGPAADNLRGICKDTKISMSFEDFKEARREMWASFPRERFFE